MDFLAAKTIAQVYRNAAKAAMKDLQAKPLASSLRKAAPPNVKKEKEEEEEEEGREMKTQTLNQVQVWFG